MATTSIGKFLKSPLFFLLFFLTIPYFLDAVVQDIITLEVGVKTLVVRDKKRDRILITEVFYPAENSAHDGKTTTDIFDRVKEAVDAPILQRGKKYPLLVVSHGQKGDRFSLSWLSRILAAYGYIIASPDHFGSTWSNNNPEEAIQRWKRTEDISFVIDALIKDPIFGPHVNEQKIGMIGYSLGALTGIWLAGGISSLYERPSLSEKKEIELEEGLTEEMIINLDLSEAKKSHLDPRIKSFLLLAPVYGTSFDKAGLFQIKAPVFIIAAENDTMAPFSQNAALFNERIPTASLLPLKKGGHTIFLTHPGNDDSLTPLEQKEIQKMIIKETLKFFDQTLEETRPPLL